MHAPILECCTICLHSHRDLCMHAHSSMYIAASVLLLTFYSFQVTKKKHRNLKYMDSLSIHCHTILQRTHIQIQRMREIYTPDIIKGMYPPPPSAGVRMSSRVLFASTCVFFRSARVHIVCIAMMFFSFRVKCLLTSIFLSLPALYLAQHMLTRICTRMATNGCWMFSLRTSHTGKQ